MARNMYGATSADFTLTAGGRVVPGAVLTLWTSRTGGTQITDLLDVDSVACTTVTSASDGSVVYYGPDGDKDPHWADSGQGNRIAIRPVDITGEPPVFSIGTVDTGTAAASLTGTSEAPVLNLTLPSAGANGVNTAAIQDSAVTAAKIAGDTITAAQIAANAVGASELADNAVDTAAIADSAVTSAKIADGTIVNADVSATAAIAQSKIARPAVTFPTWVTTFQSGHGWTKFTGTSIADDTSVFKMGSQSLLITTAAAQKTGLALDLTDRDLVVELRLVEPMTSPGVIAIYAGASGLSSYKQWTVYEENANSHQWRDGQWVRLTLPWSSAANVGTPNRAAIDTIRIRTATADGAFNLQAVGHRPCASMHRRGAVSFTFDDSLATNLTLAAPVLAQRGIAGTSYVIPTLLGTSGTYQTVAQARTLRDEYGWDLQAHGETNLTTLDEAQLRTEFNATVDAFATSGIGPQPNHLAYIGGQNNLLVSSVAREFFATARTIADRHGVETLPPGMPMHLRAMSSISDYAGAVNNLAAVQGYIDKAVADSGWAILVFHQITAGAPGSGEASATLLGQIADYAIASGADVGTVTDVWNGLAA